MLLFGKLQGEYRLLNEGEGEIFATLLPPVIKTADRTEPLHMTADGVCEGLGFCYEDTAKDCGEGLFEVTRRVRSTAEQPQKIQLTTTLRDAFVRTHWLIPCVNYNGNEYGEGDYPHGFSRDGEPWVFAYDRTGIPSCSLSEDESRTVALFASDCDETSLVSSVSVTENEDGSLDHKILYPYIEAPYSYTNTNTLSPRYDSFLDFAPGEEKIFTFYVFLGEPRWRNFGAAALLDRICDRFTPDLAPTAPPEKLWEVGIGYIETLLREYEGKRLFALARRADFGAPKFNPAPASFEIGWAGQGALNSQLFILEYIRTNDRKYLDAALDNLDAWAEKQEENGLFLAHYEWYPKPGEAPWRPAVSDSKIIANFHIPSGIENKGKGWYPEVCNLGWGAASFTRCYALLREIGIEKPEYLAFARRTCDFLLAHYSDEVGFGKSYRFDGSSFDDTGTIGAFALPALLELWRITGEEKYRDGAKRGLEFYMRRDVDNFICTAGAIDCACVDKETVYPLLVASLDLYDETGEAKYLEDAEKCGYYFFSWAYHYDALYPPTSDFARYGYHTKGGTGVSAQHHAIDSWGSLLVSEFERLYRATDDKRWRIRAKALWHNATLAIALDDNTVINGTLRPKGGQNEAFFCCRWTRYRPIEERGHFNNWLISWVSAYRLYTIHKLGFDAETIR